MLQKIRWLNIGGGIRYREHPTRKHNKKPDRYYVIYYRVTGEDGKKARKEEAVGWASDGITLQAVRETLVNLKKAQRTGDGPPTLQAKKQQEAVKVADEIRAAAARKTFNDIFEEYHAWTKKEKTWRSVDRESSLYRIWIQKTIGDFYLEDITVDHLAEIEKAMKTGRVPSPEQRKTKKPPHPCSPASIVYARAVIRQVINYAVVKGYYKGRNVVSDSAKLARRKPTDNKRVRFLTSEEEKRLLKALAVKSQDVADMAVFSLDTGARAGEIFRLRWGDVNLKSEQVIFKDTKSGHNRHVFLTPRLREMLFRRGKGKPGDLVFPGRNGEPITVISKSFDLTVQALGLNEGVNDPRQKIVFHSLRHTAASRMHERGVDLHTIGKVLGHQTLKMADRYAHVADQTLKRARDALVLRDDGTTAKEG